MKKINKKYFANPKKYIPYGVYCGNCPFHDMDGSLPIQENGYCHYLHKSDYDINNEGGGFINCKTGEKLHFDYLPYGGLLWDGCKECGIKDYDFVCMDCDNRGALNEIDKNKPFIAYCSIKEKEVDCEQDYCDKFKHEEE